MQGHTTWKNISVRVLMCAVMVCIFSACSQQGGDSRYARAPSMSEKAAEVAAVQEESREVPPQQLQSSVGLSNDGNRQFVINVNVRAQVADVYAAVLAIEEATQAEGGFITSNTIDTESIGSRLTTPSGQQQRRVTEVYRRIASLKVRVPATHTQNFLRNIAKHLEFLDQRQIEAQDVQLALLRERLNISRSRQLLQNLDDAAKNPQAQASQALNAIQIKDRAQYDQDAALLAQKELQDQVEFSTINLTLYQNQIVRTSTESDTDAILQNAQPGFAQQLRNAWIAGAEMAMSMLIALAHVWPMLLIAFAAVLGWISYRRKKRASCTNNETPRSQKTHEKEAVQQEDKSQP